MNFRLNNHGNVRVFDSVEAAMRYVPVDAQGDDFTYQAIFTTRTAQGGGWVLARFDAKHQLLGYLEKGNA